MGEAIFRFLYITEDKMCRRKCIENTQNQSWHVSRAVQTLPKTPGLKLAHGLYENDISIKYGIDSVVCVELCKYSPGHCGTP